MSVLQQLAENLSLSRPRVGGYSSDEKSIPPVMPKVFRFTGAPPIDLRDIDLDLEGLEVLEPADLADVELAIDPGDAEAFSPQEIAADADAVARQQGKDRNDLIEAIVGYIPTEIVVAWVTITGLVSQNAEDVNSSAILWLIFAALAIITPFYLYIFTYDKDKGPAWYQIVAGLVAFPVWVFTLGAPFDTISWYQPVYGSILLALMTLVLIPMGHQVFVKGLGNT